jgi:hypothetical protein
MSNTLWASNYSQSSNSPGDIMFERNMQDPIEFTSSHVLSRQLQYFFARHQRSIFGTLLNKLQQIFKSSKNCENWMLPFITVIGLAMANEIQQKNVYLMQKVRVRTEGLREDVAYVAAQKACKDIDEQMGFIFKLFAFRYHRNGERWNPILYEHHIQNGMGFDDQSSANFIHQLRDLMTENSELFSLTKKTYC